MPLPGGERLLPWYLREQGYFTGHMVRRITGQRPIGSSSGTTSARRRRCRHEHRLRVVRDQGGTATLRVVGISAASRTDRLDSVEVVIAVSP